MGKENGSATVVPEDAVRKVVVKRQCSQLEVELLQLQHQREKEDNVQLALAQANKKRGGGGGKVVVKRGGGGGDEKKEKREQEALQRVRADLDAFVADNTRTQHDFSPSLSSSERALLHEWAEELGLEHSSSGFGRNRHIMVKKRFAPDTHINGQDEIEELLYYNGYVGLSGPLVNAAGRHMAAGPASPEGVNTALVVPVEYLNNRVRRDGNESHITLVTKSEVEQVLPSPTDGAIEIFLATLAETAVDDWQDVGLGRLTEGEANEVFFRVVRWESGQKARAALGLPPKDFHITVGFKKADIHHRAKNESTLVQA